MQRIVSSNTIFSRPY